MKKVFVMLSGGVDSSVIAALIKKQGFNVIGVFMKNWSQGLFCSVKQDQKHARIVAAKLKIPFYTFNFEQEYKSKVFKPFISGIKKGITPNPDVLCNEYIKFGVFLKKSLKLGADFVATGHYAQIRREIIKHKLQISNKSKIKNPKLKTKKSKIGISIYHLMKGIDETKDQSYFLYRLNQFQLSKTFFPLGNYKKIKVREMAKKLELITAYKPDSQGICFVGEEPFEKFLSHYIKENPGNIIDKKGKIIGKHKGARFYTIGQRKGLGISSVKPFFVIKKDIKKNEIIVGYEDDKKLFKKSLTIKDLSEVFPNSLNILKKDIKNITVRIRYRQEDQKIKNIKLLKTGKLKIIFQEFQRAITKGQSAVIYKRDEVLGGGIIC